LVYDGVLVCQFFIDTKTVVDNEMRFTVKRKAHGLTLIEMLTVVAVIAILIGLLLPATSMVRRHAKKAAQKVQFSAINLGLEAFKSDFGFYPASNATNGYGGAQKLAEAMLGLDLLGFNPAVNLGSAVVDGLTQNHLDYYTVGSDPNGLAGSFLNNRKGRYLELESANAFRLGEDRTNLLNPVGGLYRNTSLLSPLAQVLCDVYKKTTVKQGNGDVQKAGAPILYYRADPSNKVFRRVDGSDFTASIYNVYDNAELVDLRATQERADKPGRINDLLNGGDGTISIPAFFYGIGSATATTAYGYAQDTKVTTYPWPYNSDTYLLISAGEDGLYGTEDDIRNFGN
jgi:prepilin-type N-terminal cleavage/methylation domain-containing protein